MDYKEQEDNTREKRLVSDLNICKEYHWSLTDVRKLTVYEKQIIIKVINKQRREEKKQMRQNKRKQRRRR